MKTRGRTSDDDGKTVSERSAKKKTAERCPSFREVTKERVRGWRGGGGASLRSAASVRTRGGTGGRSREEDSRAEISGPRECRATRRAASARRVCHARLDTREENFVRYAPATSKQHIATSCSEVLGTFTLLKTRSCEPGGGGNGRRGARIRSGRVPRVKNRLARAWAAGGRP